MAALSRGPRDADHLEFPAQFRTCDKAPGSKSHLHARRSETRCRPTCTQSVSRCVHALRPALSKSLCPTLAYFQLFFCRCVFQIRPSLPEGIPVCTRETLAPARFLPSPNVPSWCLFPANG